jgi:hypothetical protein
MELKSTPFHNIIPAKRRVNKAASFYSSPPNSTAKTATKENVLSALNTTIAEKAIQFPLKP